MHFDGIALLNGPNMLERHNISVHRTYRTNGVTFTLYANTVAMVELNSHYQMDVMFCNKPFETGRFRSTRMFMQRV